MKNCKKIISIFVIAFGLFLIPKVSFAKQFDFDFSASGRTNLSVNVNADYYVYQVYDNNNINGNYVYFFNSLSYFSEYSNFYTADPLIVKYYWNKTKWEAIYTGYDFNSISGGNPNFNSYTCTNYQPLIDDNIHGARDHSPSLDPPTPVLHILGSFSNASCNISNGSDITENIVVTAQEDYYFTSVQNGFVLSNNDTIATYDVTDLSGDFNLVATDFVTELIGSDDPPVEPPVDPPTDDPIIIGDYTFISSVPIANEFKDLFSSAINVFKGVIPYAIGLVGLGITSKFIIGLINKS